MRNPETKLLPVTTDTPMYSLWPGFTAGVDIYPFDPNKQRIFLGNIATGSANRPETQDVYAHVETNPITHKTDTQLWLVDAGVGGERRRLARTYALRSATEYEDFVAGIFLEDISPDGHKTEYEYLLEDHQAIKLAIEKGFIDEADVAPRYIPEWRAIDTVAMERLRRLRQGEPTLQLKPKRPT